MKTVPLDERIPPVRGLVPLHNRRGKPLSFLGVARALRLNRVVYKMEKIDLLFHGAAPACLEDIVRFAADVYDTRITVPLHLATSVRTDAAGPPPDLGRLKERGLLDVHLAMPGVEMPHYSEWLAAARAAGLPVRLQVQPPFPEDFEPEAFARDAAQAGVVAAVVTLADPFLPTPRPMRDRETAQATVAAMNRLAKAFADAGIESTLYGLPLCHVSEDNRGRAGNSALFFRDHQQYARLPYELGQKLYALPPAAGRTMVTAFLAQYTYLRSALNDWILIWLVQKHQFLWRVVLFVRKTMLAGRERGVLNGPRAYDPFVDAGPNPEPDQRERKRRARMGPACAKCALRRICSRKTKVFCAVAPALDVIAQEGDDVASPFTLTADQPKHYDAIDEVRLNTPVLSAELADEANKLVINTPPTRVFAREEIWRENAYHVRMPGAIRWYSVTAGEVQSSSLHWCKAPFTVAVTAGGGIADYVGFAIGRSVRVVCPMDAFSHLITLHVKEDGRFVLLRDGVPMQPVEFVGAFYVPVRLPTVAQLRLSFWNIDEAVCTQNLRVWEDLKEAPAPPTQPRVSVVVVSTRFTRRLQAVLLSLVHQEGIPLTDIEVVIGYIPGVDATDDLLNSVAWTYPGLRIVRSAFPPQNANSKGLIINESVERSSGEWVMILDSDVVLPPDLMARLLTLEPGQKFAGPEGRKMLPRDTTAQILLGALRPWECWEQVMEGPGEFRDKGTVPVGFCQCVRRECFETVRYNEYEHFEGADWEFAIAMRDHFGPVTWLEGPVLHLDHGGSQWYGVQGHM